MIEVKFFASLRDQLGTDALSLEAHKITTAAEVRAQLIANHPHWQTPLSAENLLVAINQTMGNFSTSVHDGDEVAFFPPVTGG
ncbi:molybdopterin converting factor subunit 1 [Simiduia sp. 21SJ11W-1]|uniref:molybdopterin converting factor subunit 1 n=1 Tax=Simiduia sp. 21SJ11W-1 TaxID=2909669 RepID=UPI00209D2EAB|nr:molybdopterin converting factor subunit 1 [Simiduia sp. 21SJ11W-1]UTA46759.1 molybdopterin converting factor subunit 1 [Simiduia sp. 21SJ11W-1]